jgi:hypothetical protein
MCFHIWQSLESNEDLGCMLEVAHMYHMQPNAHPAPPCLFFAGPLSALWRMDYEMFCYLTCCGCDLFVVEKSPNFKIQ